MEKRMEQQIHTKTIEILVGIPCSGKSTYSAKRSAESYRLIISRDSIREFYYGKRYKFANHREERVTKYFNFKLECGLQAPFPVDIILDNTHCREKYINEIIRRYSKEATIKLTFFDIPLYKAHYRNVVRYLKTGKWIPVNVISNMKKSYDKINREKYAKYNI